MLYFSKNKYDTLMLKKCLLKFNVYGNFKNSFQHIFVLQLSERAKERRVPASRFGRVVNFGGRYTDQL